MHIAIETLAQHVDNQGGYDKLNECKLWTSGACRSSSLRSFIATDWLRGFTLVDLSLVHFTTRRFRATYLPHQVLLFMACVHFWACGPIVVAERLWFCTLALFLCLCSGSFQGVWSRTDVFDPDHGMPCLIFCFLLAVARGLGIDTKKCTSAAYCLKRIYQQHILKQVKKDLPDCCALFCACSFACACVAGAITFQQC